MPPIKLKLYVFDLYCKISMQIFAISNQLVHKNLAIKFQHHKVRNLMSYFTLIITFPICSPFAVNLNASSTSSLSNTCVGSGFTTPSFIPCFISLISYKIITNELNERSCGYLAFILVSKLTSGRRKYEDIYKVFMPITAEK